jgi:hypothetical protein
MEREFKIDITLAAELAQFLEALLNAEFNEEFDAEEACTDTFLDQFMPNGHVPNSELIDALLNSGIITRKYDPTDFEAYDLVPIPGSPGEFRAVKKV